MQTDNDNTTEVLPLYKKLDRERTQGEMQPYSTVSDIKYPFQLVNKEDNGIVVCNFLSNIYDESKEWKEAKVNAEYTALAVNNLKPIAEALDNSIKQMEVELLERETHWDYNDGNSDTYNRAVELRLSILSAKEALQAIS